VLPNEGYDEQYFEAYIERWSGLAGQLGRGLTVSAEVAWYVATQSGWENYDYDQGYASD
jgi:hypothetical protein